MNRFLAGLAAFISFLLAAFTMGRKSASDQIRAETAEDARKLEAEANKIDQQGAENEQQIRDEINNNPVRDIDLD